MNLMEQFANHVWQSTLFAAGIGVLTLAFRKNAAAVRHGLWMAASLKFAVPFAVLVAIGSQFGFRTPVPISIERREVVIVEKASHSPLPPLDVFPLLTQPAPRDMPWQAPPGVLALAAGLWIGGALFVVGAWCGRWRRVATIARAASPIETGREVDRLRQLERSAGVTKPIALVSSDAPLEPGVLGILRPVLVWPRTIAEHLDDEQIETILAHEVSHVRRRDNLAAAVHMAVQALFWFHPLVWWIGARLVDERERACDEDVLTSGNEPERYAETILKACRLYVESPLPCVAGVTGSDLKRRIERIMTNNMTERLTLARKAMLAACIVAPIAAPILVGAATAPTLRATTAVRAFDFRIARTAFHSPNDVAAQTATASKAMQFEVASIKPNKSGDGRIMIGMQPGGRFTATNVPLRMLIRNAYQLQDSQIVGGPDWMATDRYDIVAKAEEGAVSGPPPPLGQPGPIQLMLRSLLAERFKLVVHNEDKEMPIFALVLNRPDGKLGSQLTKSDVDCAAMMGRGRGDGPGRGGPPPGPPQPGQPMPCGIRMAPGNMVVGAAPISQIASTLSQFAGRIVIDKTGLTGNYDMNLTWTPDNMPQRAHGAPEPLINGVPIDPNGPSIFTAVMEQLGLKLDSQKAPINVLVIERAEHPVEN
jgi:bla regulator protein BlaR1